MPILLLTLFGCTNATNKKIQTKILDTIAVVKIDEPNNKKPEEKAIKKDTIRNEEATQMSEDSYQKAVINPSDSSLNVYQNIRADYRIFGYRKPDTNSRKMIFFSVFTTDVDKNPYKCSYGSYYSSSEMENMKMKYVKDVGNFIEAKLIRNENELLTPIYILKSWVEF